MRWRTEPGQVTVWASPTIKQIRTARFPSNFELSQARAETVANALKAQLKDPNGSRRKARARATRSRPMQPRRDDSRTGGRKSCSRSPRTESDGTSTMRSVVRSRWFTSAFVVLALIVAVWIFGPLLGIGALHPLDNEIARFIAIAALVAGWIIWNLVRMQVRANRRDQALAEGIAERPSYASRGGRTASAEEIARLKDRLDQAMKALRKSPLGPSRRRLAAMPWYMFIGPPGAGKTTALVNSGLNFPLADTRRRARCAASAARATATGGSPTRRC